MTIAQESPDNVALRLQLDEYKVAYLHYMTPFGNCQSIFDLGILSFNHAKRIQHIHLANPSVQRQRNKMIPGSEKPLHDYVPLYFAKHTPMQHVWTIESDEEAPILNQEDLVFIDLDAFQVLQIHGIRYTAGNAAARATIFHRAPVDLSVLDWKVIRTNNCFSKKYKRRKAAEVLVPNCIPVKYFSRIVVHDDHAAERLKRETDITLLRLEILVDPSYYY
ncbi:DarT ssDNA thymidine ADP-ribosyltransferase family protein [Chloroflexota bacterium]